MKKIQILLADDHKIFREGLRLLLLQVPQFHVAGEAEDGMAAVRLAKELEPQVVVMDIGMPVLNGVEATRQILASDPAIRVIGLSVHKDRQFIKGMLMAGAKGYLPKNCAGEELVHAIRTVMESRTYLSGEVVAILAEDYARQLQGVEEVSLDVLTEREREVLRLLALGQHNKQIAVTLDLAEKTIENHRQHIMEKIGAHSAADLARFAMRQGLISPED